MRKDSFGSSGAIAFETGNPHRQGAKEQRSKGNAKKNNTLAKISMFFAKSSPLRVFAVDLEGKLVLTLAIRNSHQPKAKKRKLAGFCRDLLAGFWPLFEIDSHDPKCFQEFRYRLFQLH